MCVCINKLFNFFGHRFADNGVGLSFARYFLCVCARACVTAGGRGGRQVTSFKKYFFLSFFISRVCVCVSDGSYPKDVGSSQEVSESIFVGESGNRGTNGGQNKYWGVGGVDGNPRTLPRNK